MPHPELTDADIAELLANPTRTVPSESEAVLAESAHSPEQPDPSLSPQFSAEDVAQLLEEPPLWDQEGVSASTPLDGRATPPAKYERLLAHYPAAAVTTNQAGDPVVVLGYSRDGQGTTRNFEVDGVPFFDVEGRTEEYEVDGRRVIIKIIALRPGMIVRCWEHRPGQRDTPESRVRLLVSSTGLRRLGGGR